MHSKFTINGFSRKRLLSEISSACFVLMMSLLTSFVTRCGKIKPKEGKIISEFLVTFSRSFIFQNPGEKRHVMHTILSI